MKKIFTSALLAKKPLITFFALLVCLMINIETSLGQTVIMSNANQTSVCAGTYYDPGGTGNYSNNSNYVQTFTPSANSTMSFNFTSFNTESGYDFLYIYNGNSTSAPLIGKYSNTALSGVTISSTAGDGSLTFKFTSDGATTKAGWTAAIACVPVSYRASFSGLNSGASTWCAGETRNVSLTVTNTGTLPWTSSAGNGGINLAYWWTGTTNQTHDTNPRQYLFSNLGAGQSQVITIPVTAPATSGISILNFDIVKELQCWFSDNVSGCTGPGNSIFQSSNITINALPQGSLTGNSICAGVGTGQLTFTASVPGNGPFTVVYFNGVANQIATNVTSGTPFNVATNPTTTTTYTLVSVTNSAAAGSCMASSGFTGPTAVITVSTQPVLFTVSGGGSYCSSDVGHNITLSGSEPGVSYQLKNGGVNVGSPLAGTNSSLDFGQQASSGTYTVVASRGSCNNVAMSGSITVTISTPPVSNAGTSQIKCNNGTFTLSGNIPASPSTGSWSITSGTAVITTPTAYNSTVTGVLVGTSATLRWTVSNGSCAPAYSDVTLTNSAPAIAVAGLTQGNCNNGNFTLAGNNPSPATGLWSVVSGTAAITTPSSYNSGVTGVPVGTNAVLKWTVTNGACIASDQVTLINSTPPVSNAGSDQIKCNTGTFTLAGNNPSPATGTWSVVSGTATITTPTAYNSGVTGIPAGTSATLKWTVSNGSCTPVSDNVVLTNSAPAVAIAGADQGNCNSGSFVMAGNNPSPATGIWNIVSGTATITNPTSYNSGVTGVTPGTSAVLQWTVTNGACTASDQITLTNSIPPASISVNPATSTICYGSNVMLTGSATTSSNGLVSAGSDNFNGLVSYTSAGSSAGLGFYTNDNWTQRANGNTSAGVTINSLDGSNFMLTDLNAIALVANESSTLTSPSINTNGYSGLTLSFQHAYKQGSSGSSGSVQVSVNNGTSWTTVKSYTASTTGTPVFVTDNIDLGSYINQSSVTIRFNANLNINFSINSTYWALDNVVLTGISAPLFSWTANTATGVNGLPVGAATLSTSNKSITVNPTATTIYSLTVGDALSGCSTTAASVATVTVTPTVSTPAAITPAATVICQASAPTAYTTSATNATSFSWSVTGAGNTISGTGSTATVTWAAAFSGTATISVKANGCNGPSAASSATVIVTPTVGTPAAITPSATVICQASAPSTYTTSSTNATSYSWTVSGAGNIISGTGTTATVTWASGFSGTATISVKANGCNGPSAASSTMVTVTPTVGTPAAIIVASGTEPGCQLVNGITTTSYSTAATNSTSYNWSISNALAGSINAATGVMTWANGFSGMVNIQVTANGCSGPSAQVIRTVTVAPTVGTPAAITIISGTEPGCQLPNGTTTTTYATSAANSTGYNWSISNSLAGSINAATGVMTWANGFLGTVNIQVTANGCSGPSVQVVRTVVVTVPMWTGAVSSDWNTAANWCSGTVPGNSTNVTIPAGTPYNPVVSAAVAMANNIIIASGATLTINGNTLQIAGTVSNSGTFNAASGAIEFNGTAVQTIAAGTFAGNAINDLMISNSAGVTLGGSLDVYHSLTYNKSGAILNTNGNLTLKSTISQTAWVGDMSNGHTINGAVTVERYIATGTGSAPNHGKSWQLLAVPTQGQSIKQSWQEGATMSNIISPAPGSAGNPVAGYGTMITSDVAGAATQTTPGFDALTTPGPSMKVYDYATGNYIGPASTSLPIYNQKGYFTFVRGDRSVTAYNQSATPTILRTKGTLFTPASLPPVTTVLAGKFESVGNPYAAPVDIRNVTLGGGTQKLFIVWDPRLGGAYNYGAFQYIAYNPGTGNYEVSPGGGSYGAGGTVNNYVQSGQAFLVQAFGSNGTVSFDESAKAGNATFTSIFTRQASGSGVTSGSGVPGTLRTSLNTINADGSTKDLVDGVLDQFDDSYSNTVDGLDARKTGNTGENLSVKTAGTLLAIERRHTVVQDDTIHLNLTGERVQQYRYHFEAQNMSTTIQGFIIDNYKQTRTPLSLEGTTDYNFSVENVAGSYAADRFMIVFSPLRALPVTFTSIKAYKQDKNIAVEWRVSNENNIKEYQVEKSVNGKDFILLTTQKPTSNNGGSAVYTATDTKPVTGDNYYRIRSVDVNGAISYTTIVEVTVGEIRQEININPNPITDGQIHLQFINEAAGRYSLRLLNSLGQIILAKQVTRQDGTSTELIRWDFNLAHGMYKLEVTKPDGSIKIINVLY